MPKIAHRQDQDGQAERGTATLSKIARSTAQEGADAARDGSERARTSAKAAAENGRQLVQQSAEESAEQGWSIMELLGEQTRQNMQFATAFGRSMNWDQVGEMQREFLAGSFDRMNRLAARYRSMMQAGMKPMASANRR